MRKLSKIIEDEGISFKDEHENLAKITHYLQNASLKDIQKYFLEGKEIIEKSPSLLNKIFCDEIKWDFPFLPPSDHEFTFIDLFAGIGGFRIAFQELKGKCVFSSEIDPYAKKTYWKNFGEVPFGDIKAISEDAIPGHDVLLAGFPCQAFSIAGKKGGFDDTRGTLFFDIARIINTKRPKVFMLENVKGLIVHQRGKTIETILNVLRNDLNYYVPDPQIVNAKHFGVPQKRERVVIVGFRKDLEVKSFRYPQPKPLNKKFRVIKEDEPVSAKYYLSDRYLKTLRKHRERHESKGNGFGFEIIPDDGIANAIVVGGMGKERNLVVDNRLRDFSPVTNIKGEINREGIRRMTPREWARLQGFPDSFIIPVSDTQGYKQFGNSVAIPAMKAVGENLISKLEQREDEVLKNVTGK